MEVVLADALLSRCGDRAALLRALGAPLSAERAEALRLLLQRLAAGGPAAAGEAEALRRAAWEVALERCRPLLRAGEGAAGGAERLRAARAARGALRHCVQLCGAPLAARLARDALAELAAGGGAGAEEAAVEALAAAAPRLEEPELLSRCAAAALALVREEGEGEAAAALVAGRLLPALGANGAALPRVWEGLLGAGAAPRAGRALLALSALADALLPRGPAAPGLDARLCPRFWRLVQEGLTERDGLCRKRARYLLKRALDLSGGQRAELRCPPDGGHESSLFWWSAEKNEQLLRFWETYILIMETLEGNQFVIGPLMDALSESSLYSRIPGQSIGACPPLGMRLQKFLATYLTLLPEEEKGSFLLKFIQKMTSRHWCAVPILFLSMALASIPACKVLGAEGLHALRDVLQCTMITHQILLRGAAQCYLLQTAMHLTDVEKVSFPEVSSFLLSLRPEESLRRDTLLWTELCSWLQVNDRCFRKSVTSDFERQGTSSLCQYVRSLVAEYLKTPVSERANCFMPDWFEAKLVSTMILLAADVEQMKNKCSGKSNIEWIELEAFLNPLLDVLMRLGSNAYIPTLKTDKSLQLLLKLLQTRSLKCSKPQDDEVLLFIWKSLVTPVESILEFVLRRLTTNELSTVGDLERCDLYLALIPEIVNLCLKANWKKMPFIKNFLSSLINASIRNLQEGNSEKEPKVKEQIRKAASMASLAAVCEITDGRLEAHLESLPSVDALKKFISFSRFNEVLKKPSYIEEKNSFCEETTSQGWGKIAARYVCDQWICLRFVLRSFATLAQGCEETSVMALSTAERSKEILQSALEALSILPSDQVLPVFDCMKVLVPKLLDSSEALCIEAFDLAWKIIFSLSNTQLIFWTNLKAFAQFVFDAEVLAVAANAKGQAYIKIKEIIFKVIDLSTTKTGVFNVVLNHCCQSWIFPTVDERSALTNAFLNAGNYSELITEACVFGTVFRRDQRHIQDVHAFIENLGEKCAANIVTESTNRDDHYVRVCAVKFLCLLDGSNILHKTFMEDIFIKLLDKDELVSRSRTRYYANSLQHRIKNRVWQTLLVLLPKLDQTIFYTLPRLSELAEDEWISLSKFDRFTDIPLPAAFQWCHSRTELCDLKPSDWSQQDMGAHSAEADSQPEWTDVQKKIIPWKNSTPSLDLEMAFQDRAAKLGKSNSRLIVVASLIDKPTNLGGLCRTSEIFGASALVVGSLHYIQDKQFQHLSVSAEQWLPLVEVKPSQLVDYLQQKKTEGYTIIGVEQTAKSFDLTEYCFPEKSLLLLGNEHEGIPANLIHHLDVCVEIPQQGIIRSLNVHVSGALLIWEYTRQQVIKQKQQQ
ncbi:hypothetical protein DUI87_10275 [Hirundo rustica rustica]|uniref:tRNA (guanosine(18)-2'-O)-methyltransferase TARBP1 n=1 Tax=Hirundo rustica rustica TaxID=333673 RepID=A0A3M0KP19_HIRRU|nr:hypothetical protein DUI87_10275 [Hirundo rustica rustica]